MKIKLKVRPRLPAALFDGTGTSIESDGLARYINLDYSGLPIVTSYTAANKQIAVYDSSTGIWNTVTADTLASAAAAGAVQAANNGSDFADTATTLTNLGGQATNANLTALLVANVGTWKINYTNGSSAIQSLALGAAGTLLAGNGATAAPTFSTYATLGLVTTSAIGVSIQAYDAQLFSNIPQNSKSAAYTTVLTDGQKHIFHPSADTSARTWTIDSNANVAYPIGTAITFINQHSAGVITIAITSDTLRLAGTGSTGSRSLAADGIATAIKVTTTEWIISGTGLT